MWNDVLCVVCHYQCIFFLPVKLNVWDQDKTCIYCADGIKWFSVLYDLHKKEALSLNISHCSGLIQRKGGATNNKVQNKGISDRIMFHRQHCHVIFTISKILWTNDWIVKALVTVLQLIKADCFSLFSDLTTADSFFLLQI